MGSSTSKAPPAAPAAPDLRRAAPPPSDSELQQLRLKLAELTARLKAQRDVTAEQVLLARLEAQKAESEAETLRSALYSAAAVGGVALIAGVGTALMARRSQGAALKELQLSIGEARRRASSEQAKAERWGGQRLARDLVPVSDNMDALLASANELAEGGGSSSSSSVQALREGAELTAASFRAALSKHAIERVEPALGEAFDP